MSNAKVPIDHKTVRAIKNAYRANESLGYVIHGPRGNGKTVYSCVIGSQVVGNIEEPEWGAPLKKYIKFTPREFSELVRDTKHNQIWFDWDDAGYWLNRLFWYDNFVKEALRYMTIQRTQFTAIMFSTPSIQFLPNKILEMEDVIRVRISKMESNLNQDLMVRRPRKASLTSPWHSDFNSRGGCNFLYDEYFNGLFPNDFYAWYQPLRMKYLQLSSMNLTEALDNSKGQAMKMQLEDLKEELLQHLVIPDEGEVKELGEINDSFSSPSEQEKAYFMRKEAKRKPTVVTEAVAAVAVTAFKNDVLPLREAAATFKHDSELQMLVARETKPAGDTPLREYRRLQKREAAKEKFIAKGLIRRDINYTSEDR